MNAGGITEADHVTAAKWDRHYAAPDYIFGTDPNVFLTQHIHRTAPGGRVLVPGDGEGRNGVWLAQQGFVVTTIEASAVGVSKARALAALRGVDGDFRHGNLQDWNWPIGTFDTVASVFVHFVPNVRRTLHRRMLDALKPGGVLLLEAFTPRHVEKRKVGSPGGPPPEMLYTAEVLREDFSGANFDLLEEVDVVLDEGIRHHGVSSIVRLVARRSA